MTRREMRCSRGPSPSSLLMLAQEDLALCSSKSNQSFSLRQFPIFTRSLHFPKQELPIVSSNHPSSITIYFLHFFLSIVLIVTSSSMGTKKLNITTWGAYGKMRSIGYLLKLIFLRQDEENRIPVKAYFLCTSVDLKSMQAENADNVIPPTSRLSNYVALQYCDFPPEITVENLSNFEGTEDSSDGTVMKNTSAQGLGVAKAGCCRYMVAFQYGSAVLFNIADHEVENYLEIVRKHASGLLPDMRKDDYGVVENPHLETWMQGGPDKIVLKKLDCDGVRIIGSVLGQSVALDYFVRQVDDMVEEFTDINRGMEKTGTFTMQRKKLFQLVGKANSNLADVILKLGLLEGSEIAWRNANYCQIWEYLRDEYELSTRFGSLDFKLKFVEHNIHFLQEILQNRKSDFLEWGVILLISLDVMISLYKIVETSPIAPLKLL